MIATNLYPMKPKNVKREAILNTATKSKLVAVLSIRTRYVVLAALLALALPATLIHAEDTAALSIKRFKQVVPGIYRGSQPPKEAFPKLKEFGIRTVVNFRHEKDRIKEEEEWVRGAGMEYVSIPWTIMGRTKPEVMKKFFSILDDPTKRPVFFHCRRGVERTGVASVLTRMKYEGLSRKEAEKEEMKPFPVLIQFKPFTRKRIADYDKALFK